MKDVIMKYVVLNALKYGKPSEKAVMGKIMAEMPELRNRAKEVFEVVKECIREFNSLSEAKRKELLSRYSLVEARKEKVAKLPPLEGAEEGKVVMRFAPNPNGAPTLGSARGIVVNDEYCKIYKGKFILRFDDTDPRTKRPILEAYDWYIEDCRWLGAEPKEIVYASKRIPIYYDYCKRLIEMGKAYPCFCSREEFKKFRDVGVECLHRSLSEEYALEIWEKMLEGEYGEGEVVIRIKTDMKHRDPAIRDWVAFRIIYEDHPLVGDRYFVWPTLDFESAIEDHILGITHIIRGKDLRDSELRQRFIYMYFDWNYPITKHWGKVSINEFGKISTSELKREIESGKYESWDDPRLPTITSFRRRGFMPEAIRKFILSLGVGENDVAVSVKNLYAENRKLIDPIANRYFFVWNPVEVFIEGVEERDVRVPLHPLRGGVRIIRGRKRVYITEDDFKRLEEGDSIRLKDFCNVKLVDKDERIFEFVSYEVGEMKRGKIIHWLSEHDAVRCEVIGEVSKSGFAEVNALKDLGKVVQFERFAFCRLESFNEILKAVYTHP